MKNLLYYLRALSELYQHAHWRVSGNQYYGDHLLYERLYDNVNEELDIVAEKIIGVADDPNAIKPNEDAEITKDILSKLISDDDSSDDFPQKAIVAEQGLMKIIKNLMEDGQSDGVEDMLQGIASKHEEHLYLLQQRNRTAMSSTAKLFKLAYHLDLQGLHSEADAIAEVMKSLSERVGLNKEDMVALADHFDAEGNYEMASKFDKMAQEVLNKESSKKSLGKAKHPPPKKWFEEMKKEIKKNDKDYTDEVANQIVGDIWYNNLKDKKREEIYKRHGKKKSPNK